MPCLSNGSVTVCTGPGVQLIDSEPGPVLWCFKCRERRMHMVSLEHQNSPWFDDEWRIRCDRCGTLAVDFHGNCIDLGRWPQDAEDAAAAMEARADSWPKPDMGYMDEYLGPKEDDSVEVNEDG